MKLDPRPLYHYTCDHGHDALRVQLEVRPNKQTDGLAWFTDLAVPVREPLGLTSHWIACDRTRFRYEVTDASGIEPWIYVRRELPAYYVAALERSPGARPRHWFVARSPVPVRYSPLEATDAAAADRSAGRSAG